MCEYYLKKSALFFILMAALLVACAPARVAGIYGEAFISTDPALQISTDVALSPVASGVHWVPTKSDTLVKPNITFRYALYGNIGTGPVTQHVHAIQASLPNKRWRFDLESYPLPNSFSLMQGTLQERWATIQMFPVVASTDWFSQVWVQNGREVPAMWLAKRWSTASLEQDRVVIEYREALPEDMQLAVQQAEQNGFATILTVQQQNYLKEFSARAEVAVHINAVDTIAIANSPQATPPSISTSSSGININALVGSVEYLSRGDADVRRR